MTLIVVSFDAAKEEEKRRRGEEEKKRRDEVERRRKGKGEETKQEEKRKRLWNGKNPLLGFFAGIIFLGFWELFTYVCFHVPSRLFRLPKGGPSD